MMPFTLRLYQGEQFLSEEICTALTLEREAYTPYDRISATFLSERQEQGVCNRLAVFQGDTELFMGLADSMVHFRKNGKRFTKVTSRSFTALLTQNELKKGEYYNLTIGRLVEEFCQMPYVTYEADPGTGYINVKDGTSLWDCVVCFGYKLKHHYPYVMGNKICLTPSASAQLHSFTENQVVEYGTILDTTKIISHCHMEGIDGTEDAYEQENPPAATLNIVRHKRISFDRQFLSNPADALSIRNRMSLRGYQAKYLIYNGFANEQLGERISFGTFLDQRIICRVRMTFGQSGLRTKLWAYEDGFYNQ